MREALEPFEKAHKTVRDKWRSGGFKGIETSTRLARIALKSCATVYSLPHQPGTLGANGLVVALEKTPMCLRCKATRHIRKDCRVPRYQECNSYGHEAEDCMKTYAAVTEVARRKEVSDLVMDVVDDDVAAAGAQ